MVLPRVYAILDVDLARARDRDPLELAVAFLEGGARLVQLRAKALPGSDFLALARALVEQAHARGARVILNDRADIAWLAGADGVHVGQDDLPPSAVRGLLPGGAIGLSTHTREQFDDGLAEPVDYLAVGPVFETGTKDTGYAALGLPFVTWAAARTDRPIVAIGGITLDGAPDVIAAGAASVAVISDLLTGDDPAARVRAWTHLGPEP
jgi:thiamine-phosphate pyrophosphorylase